MTLALLPETPSVAAPADTTTDPAGTPHHTHGACDATWLQVPVSHDRPELGDTREFGHPKCEAPATIDRFVKAAHAAYYRPAYACPTHARN